MRLLVRSNRHMLGVVGQNDSSDCADLAAFAAEHATLALRRDELAARDDRAASRRDAYAIERDMSAADRDRVHNGEPDGDGGFIDRLMSAGNRDDAAGDRADARDDRRRARADREQAATDRDQLAHTSEIVNRELATLRLAIEHRTVLGQATGILMERHGLSADRSFAMIVKLSNRMNVKASTVAAELVAAAGPRIVLDCQPSSEAVPAQPASLPHS